MFVGLRTVDCDLNKKDAGDRKHDYMDDELNIVR